MKLRPFPKGFQPTLKRGQRGFIMNPFRYSSSSGITAGDAWRDQTVLNLRGVGSNGQTTTTDESPKARSVTMSGGAVISTAQSVYNGSSYLFNGTSAYLTMADSPDWDLLGDFCFEFEFRSTGTTGINQAILGQCDGTGTSLSQPCTIYLDNATQKLMAYGYTSAGAVAFSLASTTVCAYNTWNRGTMSRTGSKFELSVNGVVEATTTNAAALTTSSTSMAVGRLGDNAYYFKGHISHVRLTKGSRLPGTHKKPNIEYTPNVTLDGYWNDVVQHITADETNGVAAVVDRSINANTWAFGGGATVTNAQSRYGSCSLALPAASSSYMVCTASNDFPQGTRNFTLEADVRFTSVPGTVMYICGSSDAAGSNASLGAIMQKSAANKFVGFACSGAAVIGQCTGTTTVAINTWYHVCYMRIGSNFYLFVNGVLEATASSSSSINNSVYNWAWGRCGQYNGLYFDGHMANMRVTCAARYNSAGFVQPNAKHPITEGDLYPWHTVLQCEFNGTDGNTVFTDLSKYARALTTNGAAQVDTGQSVFGGASGLFDGSGDYISTPDAPEFSLSNLDYTFEVLFRLAAVPGSDYRMFGQADTTPSEASRSIYILKNVSNKFSGAIYDGVGGSVVLAGTTTLVANTWYDGLFGRQGTTFSLFLDNTREATTTSSMVVNNSNQILSIGRWGAYTVGDWNGWIDSLRYTVGVARQPASARLKRRLAFPTIGW